MWWARRSGEPEGDAPAEAGSDRMWYKVTECGGSAGVASLKETLQRELLRHSQGSQAGSTPRQL
eukprot:6595040-Pyramimonas_sp.AAC.1